MTYVKPRVAIRGVIIRLNGDATHTDANGTAQPLDYEVPKPTTDADDPTHRL